MTEVSAKTVRLARGKHRSPDHGACAVELASMLAGEPFSDRPRSVCRAIAAVVRSYNDATSDARRQDLYGCAAAIVGTRAPEHVERARAAHCVRAIEALRDSHETSWWWRVTRASRRTTALMLARTASEPAPSSEFGFYVGEAFSAAGERGHVRFLSLIEELVAIQDATATGGSRRRSPAGSPGSAGSPVETVP